MKKLSILLSIFLFCIVTPVLAQLPDCSGSVATIIYIQNGSSIYNYDVTQPLSATNPVLNTISMPSGGGGLAVANNLNSTTAPSPTFYTSVSNNWWYYDGTTWVNTGHSCGSTAAVNSGGGGNYLYNLVGASGQVYQYDGTGNSTLLLTVPGFSGGGPYDLVGDCDGGFYILRTNANGPYLRKYSSAGTLVSSWTTTGSAGSAGGGFAIANNTVYYNNSSGFKSAPFTAPSSNLAFTNITGTIPNPSDMAVCRVCDSLLPPPLPNADFGMSTDSICIGDCITFNDLSTDTPTAWNWTFPSGTPSTSSLQNPGTVCFTSSGTHTIQLIVSNANGSDTTSKTVEVLEIPNAQIAGDNEICLGESVTLTANPSGRTYLWNTSATSQIITESPIASTNYQVIVSNAFCMDTASFSVNVNPLPSVTATSTLTDCDVNNGTATAVALGGTPAYSYLWNTSSTSATATDLGVGSYIVSVTDSKNCTATTTVSVGVHPNPTAVITPYPIGTVRIGESIQLTASGGSQYLWTPNTYLSCDNCPDPISTPLNEQINYCVNVIDDNGCTDTACTTILIDTSCSAIFIPNAFSPNGDGLNDYIRVENTCPINKMRFAIFNRWGQKVFESNSTFMQWDGTFGGEPVPIGTYFYYLNADLINSRKVIQRGDITVIR